MHPSTLAALSELVVELDTCHIQAIGRNNRAEASRYRELLDAAALLIAEVKRRVAPTPEPADDPAIVHYCDDPYATAYPCGEPRTPRRGRELWTSSSEWGYVTCEACRATSPGARGPWRAGDGLGTERLFMLETAIAINHVQEARALAGARFDRPDGE